MKRDLFPQGVFAGGQPAAGGADATPSPGLCQDCGFLLVVDPQDARLLYHSANLPRWLDLPAGEVCPVNLQQVCELPPTGLAALLASVQSPAPRSLEMRMRTALGVDGSQLLCSAHLQAAGVVLEFMLAAADEAEPSATWQDAFADATRCVNALERQTSVEEFTAAACQALQRMSGYDRVMIHRLLPDGSSEVLAEAVSAGLQQTFLGVHLPASEVAIQSLEAHKQGVMHVLADAHASPVPVLAVAGVAREPGLDLGLCQLRQPAATHVRYLQEVGARATMTISLLRGETVWGMVGCQHGQPKVPPLQLGSFTRLACLLVAQSTMAQLDGMLIRDSLKRHAALRGSLEHLVRDHVDQALEPAALGHLLGEIGGLLRADAVGVRVDDHWLVRPGASDTLLAHLDQRVPQRGQARLWFTDALAADFGAPAAAECGDWAGAVVVPLASRPAALVLLRRRHAPAARRVGAGDTADGAGPGRRPQVPGCSEPWSAWDLEAALDIARAVDDLLAQQRGKAMQARLNMLASCVDRLGDMVIITDAGGVDPCEPRILYVNRTYTECTGYAAEEVIGRSPRLLQGPETDPAERERMRKAIAEWQPCKVELINYRRDGEPYWTELDISPLFDSQGVCTHYIGINRLLPANPRAGRSGASSAHEDSVTGLPGRPAMLERLNGLLARRDQYGSNAALLLVNLDRFQTLNESAGRAVGDELLRLCGQRLSAIARREDMVSRLNADEFALLLATMPATPEAAASSLSAIVEEVVSRLSSPFELADRLWYSTASAAAVLFTELPPGQGAEDVLMRAQSKLSHVKARGGNGWELHDAAPRLQQAARREDDVMLRMAAMRRELVLRLQLEVDAAGATAGHIARLVAPGLPDGSPSPQAIVETAPQAALAEPLAMSLLELAGERWRPGRAEAGAAQAGLVLVLHPELVLGAAFKAALLASRAAWQRMRLVLRFESAALAALTTVQLTALADIALAVGVRVDVACMEAPSLPLEALALLPVRALVLGRCHETTPLQQDQARRMRALVQGLASTLGTSMAAAGVTSQAEFAELAGLGVTRLSGPWVDDRHGRRRGEGDLPHGR